MGGPGLAWWLFYLILLVHTHLPYGVALVLVVQNGGHHTHIPGNKSQKGEETKMERTKEDS